MYQKNKNRLKTNITGIEKTDSVLRVACLAHRSDDSYQVQWNCEIDFLKNDLSGLVALHPEYFKNVVLGLPEADVVIKNFSLSENTSPDQIIPQLEVMFENYFPYPIEEMHWDYFNSDAEISVAAVKKEVIKNKIDVFNALHIPIHIIDHEQFALQRFFYNKTKILNHLSAQDEDRYKVAIGLALHPFKNAVRNYDINCY